MAEKTAHYDLTVFDEEQSTLTFKEWRQAVAGNGTAADGSDFSDIQKIDALLFELATSIENGISGMQNFTDDAIAKLKEESANTIANSGSDILIGGETGAPISFNDGVEISKLENGTFKLNGVEVDHIKIKNYLIKYNNGNDHLQFVYRQNTEGGGI